MKLEHVLGEHFGGTRLVGVSILDKQTVYVRAILLHLDAQNVDHTVMLRWQSGAWGQYFIDAATSSHLALGTDKNQRVLSLCPDGRVHIASASGFAWEMIDATQGGPNALRSMLDIRGIGGVPHACGMARIAYRRERPGEWSRIDGGARDNFDVNAIGGFKSIDGFPDGDFYAVGFEGEVWRRSGESWQLCQVPTNVKFESVVCVKGQVFAAGGSGVLLRGRGSTWEVLHNDVTRTTLWSVRSFKGRIFTASSSHLMQVIGDTLQRVEIDHPRNATSYLDGNDEVIWSVGASAAVYSSNGVKWSVAAALPG